MLQYTPQLKDYSSDHCCSAFYAVQEVLWNFLKFVSIDLRFFLATFINKYWFIGRIRIRPILIRIRSISIWIRSISIRIRSILIRIGNSGRFLLMGTENFLIYNKQVRFKSVFKVHWLMIFLLFDAVKWTDRFIQRLYAKELFIGRGWFPFIVRI